MLKIKEISELSSSQLSEIIGELKKADEKHGHMLDPKEGWHTLMCEMWELKREMSRHNKDYRAYRTEMKQVAAMGLKLFRDCSSKEEFEKLCY